MVQSAYAGRGLANRTDHAISEMRRMTQERMNAMQDYYKNQQAQQGAQTASEFTTLNTGQGNTPAIQQTIDPALDPNSNLHQRLLSLKIDPNEYVNWSPLKKNRLVTDKLLDDLWLQELRMDPQLASTDPTQLERMKQQFKEQRNQMYGASVTAAEKEEGFWGRVGNAAADLAEGALDTVAAVGDIAKPAFGNDNWFSSGVDSITDAGKKIAQGFETPLEQQREELMHEFISKGEWTEVGKLFADNPMMVVGEAAKVLGGVGLYGTGTKLAGKGLAKGARALSAEKAGEAIIKGSKALAESMPAYSALMGGGGTAQELQDRGIDLQTPEGLIAVATSALGNGLVTKIIPATAEKQIMASLMNKGVSSNASREAAQAVIEQLSKGGMFGKTAKYAGRTVGNTLKSGGTEFTEEYMQTGWSAIVNAMVNDDGTIKSDPSEITPEQWANINKTATGAGLIGAIVGGGIGAARNGTNRFGSSEKSAEYNSAKQRVAYLDGLKAENYYDFDDTGAYAIEKEGSKVDDLDEHARAEVEKQVNEKAEQAQAAREKAEAAKAQQDAELAAQAQAEADALQAQADELAAKLQAAQDEVQARVDAQQQRDAELAEYGQFKPQAETQPHGIAAKINGLYDSAIDAITQFYTDNGQQIDPDMLRNDINRATLRDGWTRLKQMASVSPELEEQVANIHGEFIQLDKDHKGYLNNRTRSRDGLLFTPKERTELATLLSEINNGNKVEEDDITNDKWLTTASSEYADLASPISRAIKDNNGQIIKHILQEVQNRKSEAAKQQKAMDDAIAASIKAQEDAEAARIKEEKAKANKLKREQETAEQARTNKRKKAANWSSATRNSWQSVGVESIAKTLYQAGIPVSAKTRATLADTPLTGLAAIRKAISMRNGTNTITVPVKELQDYIDNVETQLHQAIDTDAEVGPMVMPHTDMTKPLPDFKAEAKEKATEQQAEQGDGGTSNSSAPSGKSRKKLTAQTRYRYNILNAWEGSIKPDRGVFEETMKDFFRYIDEDLALGKGDDVVGKDRLIERVFQEHDGRAMLTLLATLNKRVLPSTGRKVGNAIILDLLTSLGVADHNNQTLGEFVRSANQQKIKDFIAYNQEWLDANKPLKVEEEEDLEFNLMRLAIIAMNAAVRHYAVTPKGKISRSETIASYSFAAQLSDETLGAAFSHAFKNKSLADVLGSMKTFKDASSLQGRIIEAMRQRAIDNDIETELLSHDEMVQRFGANTIGAYDNQTGKIYVREGASFTQMANAVVHEATHAYLNRVSSAWHSFRLAAQNDPNIKPSDFGITQEEVELLTEVEEMMNAVRDSDLFIDPKYNINLVETENGIQAYGLSFDKTDPNAIGEFMAELFSSEGFRRATQDTIAKNKRTSAKEGRSLIRRILDGIARMFGFRRKEDTDAVTRLVEKGLNLMDDVPYRAADGMVSFAKGQTTKPWQTRFIEDEKRGIQYYTFRAANGISNNHLGVASASRDLTTGLWTLQYQDPNAPTGYTTITGLTAERLADEVINNNLEVIQRNGHTNRQGSIADEMERINMVHPQLASLFRKIHQFIMTFTTQENADMALDWMIDASLTFEMHILNKDALHTWMERVIRQMYPVDPNDPNSQQSIQNRQKWVDLQRRISIDRANYNNQFSENGIGNHRTMKQFKDDILEFANQVGWDRNRLEQVTYALMAQERTNIFNNNPGGIDPYTGQPIRQAGKVSGFEFNGQKDDDGSLFFAAQSADELNKINQFRDLWVAQNDALLDLEFTSGVLTTEHYMAKKGLFYAPLLTEGSVVKAFVKRATGRHSKAKNPFTTYYELAEARVAFARNQRAKLLLLDLAQDHALGNFIQVNQTYRAVVNEPGDIGYEWRANNLADGSTSAVFKNGIRHTITLTDEHVAKLMKKANSWNDRSAFWNTLAITTRMLSGVRTMLSPSFVPAAFARDLLSAMVNIQLAFRTNGGDAVLSNEQAAKLAPKVVARAIPAAFSILKGNWSGKRSWEYDVFKRVGGGIVMNARYDSEGWNRIFQSELDAEAKTPLQIGVRGLKKTAHNISAISHSFEDAVRFATFMEYLEMRAGRKFQNEADLVSFLQANKGIRDEAVMGSKHITGNFETKGANVGMRSAYMFFNAGMVGAQTAAHMFNPQHGTYALNAMKVIGGLSLASLALMDAELGDDDDGKSKASRVSMTENALCLGMRGCVQLPHEVRWISGTMKAVMEVAKGDISLGDGVAMSMRGFSQMANPFAFGDLTGENSGAALAMGLVPTLAQLPVQLLTNQDSFGKDIVPEFAYDGAGRRILNAQDWQRYKLSDPDWAKAMAMYGQKYFGLDNSASQYTHTAKFILGGIYSAGNKIARGMEKGEDPVSVLGKVFGSGFTPRYDEYAITRETKQKIRDMKAALSMGDNVDNMLRDTNSLKRDPRYARLIALEKQYEQMSKNLHYHGKTRAQLVRQQLAAQQTDNIDAVLDANAGLDYLNELYKQRSSMIMQELTSLESLFNE